MISDVLGVRQPKPWKSKQTPVDCAAPDQIVGLEIETEGCTLNDEQYATRLSKLWDVKTDGSLRGRAYEFISKPAEIKILIPELAEFYQKTGFTEENYTDRCSIHVHTNISDMTVSQVAALTLVYSVFEEPLFEFVNHFGVTDPRGKYRDTNIYCVPWNQCRMNHNMVQSMFSDVSFAFKRWQKYTALNILPARTLGTFEWRHMHGTANTEKLTKWLNLIGSIMQYCKKTDFEAVTKLIKQLNDTSAYQQFFVSVLGDYLPYNDTYAKAIEHGVVNAKYSLIGLRDNKPVESVTRPIDPFAALRGGDVDRVAEGIRFNWNEAEVEAPAGNPNPPLEFQDFVVGPGARNAGVAARPRRPNPPQRREDPNPAPGADHGFENARNRLIRDGVQQAVRLGLIYPLTRGVISVGLRAEWGVLSSNGMYALADGRIFFADQVNDFTSSRVSVMGLGTVAMWEPAPENFSPTAFLENAELEF